MAYAPEWPQYLPSPKQDIMALGVIALNYGQLENMFRHLFAIVAQFNEAQASALFQRLPNNHRLAIIAELIVKTTLPEKLKERVDHFCKGFEICASNRHAVMHSHSEGTFTSVSRNVRGILLSKFSKAGNKFVCPASLEELRIIADEIYSYSMFGGEVVSEIRNFLLCRQYGKEDVFWKVPLRDKPAPPTNMNWSAPESVLIEQPPP